MAGTMHFCPALDESLAHPCTKETGGPGDEYATSAPVFGRNPGHGATIHLNGGFIRALFASCSTGRV